MQVMLSDASGNLAAENQLGIETIQVAGILGLVESVLNIAREQQPETFLWFRGHSRKSHTLTPGLMRDGRPIAEVFERERRLLTRFRQRSLAYWPAGYPQSEWEHLFAMQHYGMPTRLLDWSENLFVATHFALSKVLPDEGADPPVVWSVNPILWNRSTPVLSDFGDTVQVLTTTDAEIESYHPDTKRKRNKSPVAMFGSHNSTRIVAQRGTFFIWGEDTRSLESFAETREATLWRFELLGERANLLREMESLGFGETMIFPELSSLASELSRVEGWRENR